MNKIYVLAVALLLTACGNNHNTNPEQPIEVSIITPSLAFVIIALVAMVFINNWRK
jgi:hypothetical protein